MVNHKIESLCKYDLLYKKNVDKLVQEARKIRKTTTECIIHDFRLRHTPVLDFMEYGIRKILVYLKASMGR